MVILDTVGDTIQAEASAASSITVTCYGVETASGTETYKRLGQTQLTGSGTQDTIYTVPGSTSTVCVVIVIANTSGSARTIKLWNVPNGNSPGDANAILGTVATPANSSIIWNKGNIQVVPVAGAGVAAHAILDGSVHNDSVADGVTRGSIIYGNATPKWDELVKGAADTFLGSDGTDVSYRTAAQVMASLSGEAAATFDFNSQDLTGVGAIGCGAIVGTGVAAFEGASVTVGKASTTTGTIVLHDSNSANTITLTVPDISAGSLSFTLPPTDGANTNVLQTDGNGVLTWVAAGGGAFASRCSVYLNGDQSITKDAFVQIGFNTEDYDNNTEFNTGTYTWTAKANGNYAIYGSLHYKLSEVGEQYIIIIYVDGAEVARQTLTSPDGGKFGESIYREFYLTTGQTVKFYTYHTSSVNKVLDGRSNFTWASIHRFA